MLGAILLQSEALITAMERVRTEDFYDPPHQLIYEAMVQLGEESQPIDLVTLTSKLQDRGSWRISAESVIWRSWLTRCLRRLTSTTTLAS